MSFGRYPEYKATGHHWLEIPRHWDLARLGQCGRFLKGSGGSKEDISDVGVSCVRYGDLYTTHEFFINESRTRIAESSRERYTRIKRGDLLFAASGETFEDIGRSAVNLMDGEAYCGGDVIILRPFRGIDLRFLGYAADSLVARQQKASLGRGTTVKHIYPGQLARVVIALPKPGEQTAIAAFLDRETAKIDALVAEQERLIELLNEKRQAVVSHSVTKGLNSDAPMKPSRIPWFGDVPAHWNIARLGHYAWIENGTTPSREIPQYWSNGTIPWVSSGEVNQDPVAEPTGFITEAALKECSLRVLPKGTVIVGLVGQGRTRGTASRLAIEATVNQNLAAIFVQDGLNPGYLLYSLRTMYEYLREEGRGGNQAALNCEIIASLRLPIPPIQEQESISTWLQFALSAQDDLTAKATEAINLLRERRTALISAAVTGQIDVRDAMREEVA